MQIFLELHSRTLLFNHKLTSLLKKEIEDEEKLKMVNDLAVLKKQYASDKEVWQKEQNSMKDEKKE